MKGARFLQYKQKKVLFFSVHNLLNCTQVSEGLGHDFGKIYMFWS